MAQSLLAAVGQLPLSLLCDLWDSLSGKSGKLLLDYHEIFYFVSNNFQMKFCLYHPEAPQFLGPVTEGRMAGPTGRYPCCGQQAFRYEPVPGPIVLYELYIVCNLNHCPFVNPKGLPISRAHCSNRVRTRSRHHAPHSVGRKLWLFVRGSATNGIKRAHGLRQQHERPLVERNSIGAWSRQSWTAADAERRKWVT